MTIKRFRDHITTTCLPEHLLHMVICVALYSVWASNDIFFSFIKYCVIIVKTIFQG